MNTMNINFKVRFHNPVFWINLIVSTFLVILAQLGMAWEEITTWAALWSAIVAAVQNPVIIFAVLGNVWNALNDPTTSGLSDSNRAMGYDKPQ